MSDPIDPATIARWRELIAAATPLPWCCCDFGHLECREIGDIGNIELHAPTSPYVRSESKDDAALIVEAANAIPALLDQLAAQAAEIERLRAELAVERQCRNGHLPDCAGIDFEQMRCGCGYLDGTAYRSLADEIERLKAECIREHARAFAPFCEQSERADKAEARVKGLERELACLSEHAPPGHPLHSCGGPQEACMQPGCTECGTPTMEEALAMRARVAELERELAEARKPTAAAVTAYDAGQRDAEAHIRELEELLEDALRDGFDVFVMKRVRAALAKREGGR